MKYSSIIRNIFHGIIDSSYIRTVCRLVSNTASNICEPEMACEVDIGTGMSLSKYYTFTKFYYVCHGHKSHTYTHHNVIIQQPLKPCEIYKR